jgi:hypothetical protein
MKILMERTGLTVTKERIRMIAKVEKPDGSYEYIEMGSPVCGEDFCDTCGDCLHCYSTDYCNNEYCGIARWVIYIDNPKNPYYKK